MRQMIAICCIVLLLACVNESGFGKQGLDNPEIAIAIPAGFPPLNPAVAQNRPTTFGLALGERLFHETRLRGNSTAACARCHQPSRAFSDNLPQAVATH